MSDITIKSSGGATEFADGTTVKLTADVPDKATKVQWLLNEDPLSGGTGKEYKFTMGVATDGEYRVTAELDDKPIESNRVSLTRARDEEKPATFYPTFARSSAITVFGVGVLVALALAWLLSPTPGRCDLEGSRRSPQGRGHARAPCDHRRWRARAVRGLDDGGRMARKDEEPGQGKAGCRTRGR